MPKNFHRPKIGQRFLYPPIFWNLKILDDLVIFDIFWVYFGIFWFVTHFSARNFLHSIRKFFFWPKYAQKFPSPKNMPEISVSGHIFNLKNFGWSRDFWHFLGIFWYFFGMSVIFWPEISGVLSENFFSG